MMNTRDEVHVWPNSSSMEDHANHKHPSMLAQNKNNEDIRHDDHHRASLYEDPNSI